MMAPITKLALAVALGGVVAATAPHPRHLELTNITGKPELAFTPVGTVMPVGAFARLVVTVDIDDMVKQCFLARSHMIDWWQMAPAHTWAHQFLSDDPKLRRIYTRATSALNSACHSVAHWKNPGRFFEADPQTKVRRASLRAAEDAVLEFASAPPTLETHLHSPAANSSDLSQRNPRGAVAVVAAGSAIVGGAALLYHVIRLLFGGGAPAWQQEAATQYTAQGAAHNAMAVKMLVDKVKDISHFDHLQQLINGIHDHSHAIIAVVNRVQSAMYQLQLGRVSPVFLEPDDITKAMDKIAAKVHQADLHLAVNSVADVLLLPAFGVVTNGLLRIVIPVPAVTDKMNLHRYAGTPLMISNASREQRQLVKPQPDFNAIGASSSSSNHVLLTVADLDACYRIKDTFMCADLPLRLNRHESCLGSLYAAHSGAIHEHCTFVPHPEPWHVARTGPGTYVWSTTAPTSATTSCPGGASFSTHVPWGVHRVQVPPGCTTLTQHFALSTPLTPFAQVELFKKVDWDMEKPLLMFSNDTDLQDILQHVAAASHNLFNAKVAAQGSGAWGNFWTHISWLTAGCLMGFIIILIAYCKFRQAARSFVVRPEPSVHFRAAPHAPPQQHQPKANPETRLALLPPQTRHLLG